MSIEKAIRDGATLIDVRSPMEYMSGSVSGSKNIPLNEIPARIDEIKSLPQPLVVFCRSGARSEQARGFLAAQGLDVFNGGPWTNVNNMIAELK